MSTPHAQQHNESDNDNRGQLSAQVTLAVRQAQAGGKELLSFAFWKGILLVAIVFVTALIYRFVGARSSRPAQE